MANERKGKVVSHHHHHHRRTPSPSGDGHGGRGWGKLFGKFLIFTALILFFLAMSAQFLVDHNYTGLVVFYLIWSAVYMLTVSKWIFPK
jgi:hypothetical protein